MFRSRIVTTLVVSALLGVAVQGAPGAATAAGVRNGDLVFAQTIGDLVTQPPGAHFYRFLAEGLNPKYSPDGRQVAYVRAENYSEGAHNEVFVHDLKTNRYLRKTTFADARYLDWSPNGKRIVYSTGRGLEIVDLATYDVTTVPTTSAYVQQPAWSPDGKLIAFSTGDTIQVVSPQGTGQRTFTTGGGNTMPDWSPDGRTLAFITTRYTGRSEVVTLPRSGKGTPVRVSYTAYPAGLHHIGVAWAPNGKRIAVLQFNADHEPNAEDEDERFKVVAYLPDGSSYQQLTDPIVGDDGPEGLDWAPRVTP